MGIDKSQLVKAQLGLIPVKVGIAAIDAKVRIRVCLGDKSRGHIDDRAAEKANTCGIGAHGRDVRA